MAAKKVSDAKVHPDTLAARKRKDRVMHEAWARQRVKEGYLFVVNTSGGADSQAMFRRLMEFVPREQLLLVHADLHEVEWPGTQDFARYDGEKYGVPFLLAKARGADGVERDLLEHVDARREAQVRMAEEDRAEARRLKRTGEKRSAKGLTAEELLERAQKRLDASPYPSDGQRFCTSDLKRGPIRREVRGWCEARGITRIVNCVGLRAAESNDRASKEAIELNAEMSKAGRTWYEYLPIHHMPSDTVQDPRPEGRFGIIQASGDRWHWAYDLGSTRLSCVFCIYLSQDDYRLGAEHNPEMYARFVAHERKHGKSMSMKREFLEDLVGYSPEEALRRQVAKAPARRSLPVVAAEPEAGCATETVATAWPDPLMLALVMGNGARGTIRVGTTPDRGPLAVPYGVEQDAVWVWLDSRAWPQFVGLTDQWIGWAQFAWAVKLHLNAEASIDAVVR